MERQNIDPCSCQRLDSLELINPEEPESSEKSSVAGGSTFTDSLVSSSDSLERSSLTKREKNLIAKTFEPIFLNTLQRSFEAGNILPTVQFQNSLFSSF